MPTSRARTESWKQPMSGHSGRRGLGVCLLAWLMVACAPDKLVEPAKPSPGRLPLRRLTAYEYERSVQDLLGTTISLAASLPVDDPGTGFDNDAALLTVTPQLIQIYSQAARRAVADVFESPDAKPALHVVQAELADQAGGVLFQDFGKMLEHHHAPFHFDLPIDRSGNWRLLLHAAAHLNGGGPVRVAIDVNGQSLAVVSVDAPVTKPAEYSVSLGMQQPGVLHVSVAYLSDPSPTPSLRNFVLDWIGVFGPTEGAAGNSRRDALLKCDPVDPVCRNTVLLRLARRAWRRPVTAGEQARLQGLVYAVLQRGDSPNRALAIALEAILSSPNFLLRVEIDPSPTAKEVHAISGHELATRLAYFLWSTLPDESLAAAADTGRLHEPDVLSAQVERMIADPRAEALTDQMVGQWWSLRALADSTPDPKTFPSFDQPLRAAMAAETRALFKALLAPGRPVTDLLTADSSYVNDRLALHYGLPLPGSATPVLLPVDLPRRGLLGHASLLTLTSHNDRTSPTLRGKWVLAQLLCDQTPPPPPGVVDAGLPLDQSSSIRERLAVLGSHPVCGYCHNRLDPIGLGLEPFDAMGRWRSHEKGKSINATGVLQPHHRKFGSPDELARLLADDPRFARCVVSKMTAYALGRGLVAEDEPYLSELSGAMQRGGLSLRSLIHAIVASPLFQQRGPARGGL